MKDLESKIIQVLEEIKPYILSHGGDIKFVKIEEDTLYVRLFGACVTCPLSIFTVTFGIEERVKALYPQIKQVQVLD